MKRKTKATTRRNIASANSGTAAGVSKVDISELTIGQAKEIAALFGALTTTASPSKPDANTGKYVLVRTYSAGVHVGVLKSRTGLEAELTDSRRIWQWQGANTLSEISLRGVGSGSKVAEAVPFVTLTQAIEIIPCSEDAEKNLRAVKWVK